MVQARVPLPSVIVIQAFKKSGLSLDDDVLWENVSEQESSSEREGSTSGDK